MDGDGATVVDVQAISRVAQVDRARGIGAAISRMLKDKGYKVAATYAGNDTAAQKFKAETGIGVYKFDVGNFELEFWHYIEPRTPKGTAAQMIDAIGYNAIVFETDDLAATLARLEGEGEARDGRVSALRPHLNGEQFLTLDCGHELKLSRSYRDRIELLK